MHSRNAFTVERNMLGFSQKARLLSVLEFCDYGFMTFPAWRIPPTTATASFMHALRMLLAHNGQRWKAKLNAYAKFVDCAPEPDGQGSVTAIVLSYKRPGNVALIVQSLLKTPSISSVVVSNHNPDVPGATLFPSSHPRVYIVNHPGRDPYYRYVIASRLPGEFFLGVDDDVFLRPSQLETVCRELLKRPEVPHGVCGQLRRKRGGFLSGLIRYEGEVDVINRIFAFTKTHALAVVSRHDQHWPDHSMCFWDDIILSRTGSGKPVCHDVGDILFCPTSRNRKIALCKQTHFHAIRESAFAALAKGSHAHV